MIDWLKELWLSHHWHWWFDWFTRIVWFLAAMGNVVLLILNRKLRNKQVKLLGEIKALNVEAEDLLVELKLKKRQS